MSDHDKCHEIVQGRALGCAGGWMERALLRKCWLSEDMKEEREWVRGRPWAEPWMWWQQVQRPRGSAAPRVPER